MSETRRRTGRPRDPGVDRAILDAALAVLADSGWRGLSIDRVAERAGVAVTTVYRRYASVDEVLLGLIQHAYAAVPVPDTGSVRGDLVALTRSVVAVWTDPSRRSFLAALVAAIDEHPALAAAYHDGHLRRRAETRPIIARAVARGELRPDVDADLVLDVISGAVDVRVLLVRERLADDFAERLVDLILPGIRTT